MHEAQEEQGLTLTVAEAPSPAWSAFVTSQPDASGYYEPPWLEVARSAFGFRTFFIEARRADGSVGGVLPMVHQQSLLLGDRLVSLPYCSYGGPLSQSASTADALMARAVVLARSLGVRAVEFRDRTSRAGDWATRTDKVSMVLQLPSSVDALEKSLGSKLRSQVRRAAREHIGVRQGGAELVTDFYRVFAENMRDVGTPVYPRRFFDVVAAHLKERCQIVVIDLDREPVAAGFLLFHRTLAEIPWAAATPAAKARSLNMRLYWELLCRSIEQGVPAFEFGRSSRDSGTYRFKQQWGAMPVQLFWHQWPSTAPAIAGDPATGSRALASRLWTRLPLWAANRLGPLLSPGLPW